MTQNEIILACSHCAPDASKDVTIDGRQVACCCDCWNASVAARRSEAKARLEVVKEAGRAYWRARGIAIGETVWTAGMGVFGPYRADGIAKVGSVGAYVKSNWQRGFLRADCFSKAAAS